MPIELTLDLRWQVLCGDTPEVLDPLVFALLAGIREGGHLNFAAKQAGVSYRHAWGQLRAWEERLGKSLVSARQGRGAHLTAFGESLLDIASATAARLAPVLAEAALEAGAEIGEAADPRRHPLAIAASHSPRLLALRDTLALRHKVSLDIVGSTGALQRYRRGEADLAGFHLPQGDLGPSVAASLISLLDGKRDTIWLLEKRTLGLLSRPQQACRDLGELAVGQQRFVNRQPGSGTRLAFDGLLGAAGIAPGSITGYSDEEYTHTAVAALVASGAADVAFATAAVAAQFKLHFVAVVDERFYVVTRRQGDSSLRRALAAFCAAQPIDGRESMKADEFNPSVAVLKRVHRAGFWKRTPAR